MVASDGGQPQLTTTSTASISVARVGEEPPPPEVWATFTDSQFSAEVPEDAPADTLVKKLTVLNRPESPSKLRCAITAGNEEGLWRLEFLYFFTISLFSSYHSYVLVFFSFSFY